MSSDTLLARVVLPDPAAGPNLIPLYARHGASATVADSSDLDIVDRRSLRMKKGEVVSFDSFFNAFPAAHWRRWTTVTSLRLRVEVSMSARIDVYRSSGSGRVTHDTAHTTLGADAVELSLPLASRFSDGGLYWFSIRALEDGEMMRAEWHADEPLEVPGATLGICTFNRVQDCNATVARLISDPEAMRHVNRVVVVDQGTESVKDHPDFEASEQAWEGRLHVLTQPNYGGSGGFARAMYETLADPDGGDVILTDDDISPEPESFHRAMMFAAASGGRVLVHGHMLDLWAQTRLHNTGDLVDRRTFRTIAVADDLQDLELGEVNLSNEPGLSRRFEADFGGWWMCLIPRSVMEQVGLAMPVFIKWDDVEYGVRAQAAGFPTVTLPGVAVWHQPFYLKDVQTDWTAYFETRNRLLTAILHGEPEQVTSTFVDNMRIVSKNALSMNYSANALNAMALEDILAGPQHISDTLPTIMQKVREVRGSHDDARVLPAVPVDFASSVGPAEVRRWSGRPKTVVDGSVRIARAFASAARRGLAGGTPRAADLSSTTPHWSILARLDRAAVATADGAGVTMRHRDPEMVRAQMRRSVQLHRELMSRREELMATYRGGLADWVSPESWRRFFE